MAGSEGTCANVRPGTPDKDSCAAGQACDANQQCKSQNGQVCGSFGECASGHCADGVCCDTDCNDVCKSCIVTGKRGACTNVPAGNEDPVGAPPCASDTSQGRSCDGNGVCLDVKKDNGQPCTAGKQCTSGNCIDGFCCESACGSLCMACANAKTGQTNGLCRAVTGGTDPDAECAQSAQSTCGTDGMCNGSGACRLWDATTQCAGASCTGSTFTPARTCNGMGTCQSVSTVPCWFSEPNSSSIISGNMNEKIARRRSRQNASCS